MEINQLKINPIEARISWAISTAFAFIQTDSLQSILKSVIHSANPPIRLFWGGRRVATSSCRDASNFENHLQHKNKKKIKSVSNITWAVSVSFVWMKNFKTELRNKKEFRSCGRVINIYIYYVPYIYIVCIGLAGAIHRTEHILKLA